MLFGHIALCEKVVYDSHRALFRGPLPNIPRPAAGFTGTERMGPGVQLLLGVNKNAVHLVSTFVRGAGALGASVLSAMKDRDR